MPFTPNLSDFVSKSETHLNAQNSISQYCHFNTIFQTISILQNVLAESAFKKKLLLKFQEKIKIKNWPDMTGVEKAGVWMYFLA